MKAVLRIGAKDYLVLGRGQSAGDGLSRDRECNGEYSL